MNRSVLIIDDSLTVRMDLSQAFAGAGFHTKMCSTLAEARKELIGGEVDLVLLDLLLPDGNGADFLIEVRGSIGGENASIVMLSTEADAKGRIRGPEKGADEYVGKPYDTGHVVSRALELMRSRRGMSIEDRSTPVLVDDNPTLRAADEYDSKSSELPALGPCAGVERRHFEEESRRVGEQPLQKETETGGAGATREPAVTHAALVAELARKDEELERKNEELQGFTYSVSHDLRAPLRSIDGFSQALLEDYGDALDARGVDYLNRVRGAARRMDELIEALLQLARVGGTDMMRRRVDLSELARRVVHDLRSRSPERIVETEILGDVSADVDPQLVRIVLENLIGNAWKFTQRTSHPRVGFGVKRADSSPAVYFVRDNGVGFDMRYAGKLFRAFQRLHDNTVFPGAGVGLATVLRIVDRHGGRVWADGAVDMGATFYFTLSPARN